MIFNNYMDLAIKQARIGFAQGEVPVGCVILCRDTKKILAQTHNLVEKNTLSIAHSEILAIKEASKVVGNKNLSNCDIYVTLEPCAMCSSAISHARIGRLYYGASDQKHGAVENGIRFFSSKSCFHRPEIYEGIDSERSKELMQSFFRKLRKNKL